MLRLLESAFEAVPQAILQGILLYEDLASDRVRVIQWQSFFVSFLALGAGFSSIALHHRKEEKKEKRIKKEGWGQLLQGPVE